MLLSGVLIDSTCGEGSVGVAFLFYCGFRWSCNGPSKSEGGSRICPGFCASSSIHPEKFLIWDWDWHIEHCRCCRRCCSIQLRVWPMESNWSGGWPRDSQCYIVSGESCAAEEDTGRWFGADAVASLAVGEAALCTIVRISDVIEVEGVQYVGKQHKLGLPCDRVDLCQVAENVKRSNSQWVLLWQRNIFLLNVCPLVVLHLKLLSIEILRSRVREEVAVIDPMPQFFRRYK